MNSNPAGSAAAQGSVGKLGNIKKLFEEDGKPSRPPPPARPPAPARLKSPTRQNQNFNANAASSSKAQQSVIASQAAEQACHNDVAADRDAPRTRGPRLLSTPAAGTQDNDGVKDDRRLSPTVSRRINALMGRSGQPEEANSGRDGRGLAAPPKKKMLQTAEGNSSNAPVNNPLYGGFKQPTESEIADMYTKVNKQKKRGSEPVASSERDNSPIHRREAMRKHSGDRPQTVAVFEGENQDSTAMSGVSVSSRTKLFDSAKADRPALPAKPPPLRRAHSSVGSKDEANNKDQQLKAEAAKPVILTETNPNGEGVYNQPWDTGKSPSIEFLKSVMQPLTPPVFSPPATPMSPAKPPTKPPLPSLPPKIVEGRENSNTSNPKARPRQSNSAPPPSPAKPVSNPTTLNPAKHFSTPPTPNPVKSSSNQPPASPAKPAGSAPPPPRKPPRTHAHDDYLKVKLSQGKDSSSPASSNEGATGVKKMVQFIEPSATENSESEASKEPESVKDRVSRLQQQQASSFPPSWQPTDEETVILRHKPPLRPPPPKRRPSSSSSCTSPNPLQTRPVTEFTPSSSEGPKLLAVSPRTKSISESRKAQLNRHASHVQDMRPRNPRDRLPPPPDAPHTLKHFTLRKSFSSECLHSSKGSSLDRDEGMDSDYAAVIDAEGYAVPNEFMKLPDHRNSTDQFEEDDDISPSKFLTRLEGFSAPGVEGPQWGFSTAMQDQTLDKINKKKLNMVKHKINQAYADLDLTFKEVGEPGESEKWLEVVPVEYKQDVSEPVIEPAIVKKRIEYCTSVRLNSTKSIKRSKEYLSAIYPQLFEYCLVVGLRPLIDSKGYEPYVINKFPENVSSNLSVPSFCFPDAAVFKPGSATSISESYSFVMTNSDGSRVYGYCRRIQPPDCSLPEVISIISPIDSFNMYNKLLTEIESRRRISSDLAMEVIAASFGRPLPKPGKVCHIRTLDSNGEMETVFLARPSDNRLENVNYESPLCYLGTDKLVKVFSSMLMERRIVLCSSHLSVLTQTVHALSALLYPFQWQHVYIPLLPAEMLDVVCAPMPFIVGVLSVFLPEVLKMDLEEVLIVDLDKKNIVRSQGDESTILPRKVQRALKTAINMCKIDSDASTAQWLIIAEAFLRMFVELVGHFGNNIQTQQDGNKIFQKEGFILEMVSREMRQFLEWFTETQMFEVFISNHLEKADYSTYDLFLQRLTESKESKEESRRRRGLGAKVKNFGKAIKTKLQS